MLKKLSLLSTLSLVTSLLTSCADPPAPVSNLCGSVRPIYLAPSEANGITTVHLAEMVAQNEIIAKACQ